MCPAKHGQNTRGKVKEIAYEMAKKKEDVENETMRRAAAKRARENEEDDSMERQEPPDTYGGKEIQESPTDLPRLRKLLKGSIDNDISASRLRSLRDESSNSIKEKVFSILVDPSTYVIAPSTETPFDNDTIDQICGIAIGFGALDEEKTEDQQGMIITGAVLLELGRTYIGLRQTPPQESVNDANEVDKNQTLEGAIATLHTELMAEMEAK
jgi:hypothetical protein